MYEYRFFSNSNFYNTINYIVYAYLNIYFATVIVFNTCSTFGFVTVKGITLCTRVKNRSSGGLHVKNDTKPWFKKLLQLFEERTWLFNNKEVQIIRVYLYRKNFFTSYENFFLQVNK